jgi:hypothetical protein
MQDKVCLQRKYAPFQCGSAQTIVQHHFGAKAAADSWQLVS